MKNIYFFLLLNFLSITSSFAQLSGQYSIGVGRDYTKIKDAIDDLNSLGISCACEFYLYDEVYTEDYMQISNISGSSATNTILFKPQTGVSPEITITANSSNRYGIRLYMADYITFDGSNTVGGTTRDIKIIMAGANSKVFEFKSDVWGTDGATNNTVKNIEIKGYSNIVNTNNSGFYSNTSGMSVSGGDNLNFNTIENNKIYNVCYGINLLSVSDDKGNGNKIIGNEIGSDNSSEYVSQIAIFCRYQTNLEISENEVYNIINNNTTEHTGINVGNSNNTEIKRNKIHDIVYTGNLEYGAKGINIYLNQANSNITIINNFIWHIAADGQKLSIVSSIEKTPLGIYINLSGTSASGVNIYFNSIYLTQDANYGLGHQDSWSSGVAINSGVSGVNFRNNIISNSLGEGISCLNSTAYGVYCKGVNPFSNIDNNIYFLENHDRRRIGSVNGTEKTFLTWQTAVSGDANSYNESPNFFAEDDLHINSEDNRGAVITGVSEDIEGEVRNNPPDIGADEYNITYLPIELSYFRATPKNNQVNLNWFTSSETNNDYFIVERSPDAINWENISYTNGAGMSNYSIAYSSVDKTPYKGISYYRLKQVDFDNSQSYSKIVSVNFLLDNNEFSIYPNPARTYVQIESKKLDGEMIQILDITGEIIMTIITSETKQFQPIDISNLKNGIYFIQIGTQIQKLIKE